MEQQLTPTEARQLWVEALRSGEYEQGRSALCDLYRYCCLGVACEVYQKHVGGLRVETRGGVKLYENQFTVLPDKVARWLNIKPGGTSNLGVDDGLVARNDIHRHTFAQIADFIETNQLQPYED